MRLAAGGGPANTEISASSDNRIDMSGGGVDLEIAIGGIVAPNLAVHGTLWGWLISDPDVDAVIDGVPLSGELNGDLDLSGVGAGVTYFFMPVNIYLTGSVGIAVLSIDADAVNLETDTGFSFEAAAGKEWFVSSRWGLGVAVGITYHSLPDGDVDENWSGISIPVRFSATFN